ncbi:DEAD/DEAH box helicase [Arcanobacterium urinimassiliense]|uniref:DEAD/DEAH box helicase n=1 Tax=Arcanobacterium urinimassiliense TaxID=1871014 RepID=UPI0009FD3167|nr:DEAD/DEAH box helicase [Arcanobacterium urinimassiliense]
MRLMSVPRVIVCYDDARPGMYLRIEGQDIAAFTTSTAWRAWLYYPASAVDSIERDRILLNGRMGLRECQDMLEAIKEADGHGIEVVVDPSFNDFVTASETYIRERSEVGLAIKAHTTEDIADDPQLGPRFREFRNKVSASMVRPLRDRQMLDAFFMTAVGHAANFSVPGAGKTATVLGVFAYLRHLELARRIVVVCPKSGFESWEKEWIATFGEKLPLRCFSLGDPAIAAMSTERRRNALLLDSGTCNLFTFNYESLSNYVRELHTIIPDQTLLVFDESHRVKAIGGKRAEAALEAADGAKFVIALTGTPIPNTYQDIYNLLHILYPKDYDMFFGYEPDELHAPDADLQTNLNNSLAPFFCRTNKDELGVPRPEPDEIVEVEATPDENTLLRILYASCPNAFAKIIRTLQLESDPEMLCSAVDPEDLEFILDQVGDDYLDIDYVDFSQTFYEAIERSRPSSKLVACERLVERIVAEGRPVIVWCIFVRSIKNLRRDLTAMGIPTEAIYGATPQEERREILDDFRAGRFKVLMTNPQTLAESVSLHSVCHDAVYFEYSYNLVHLLQSKDRIHRLGLPDDQKTRYYFMHEKFILNGREISLDAAIYNRLKEKEQTMLDAIDRGYLEDGYLDEEDLRIIFEQLLGEDANNLDY